jgi:hypothetical protein
MDNHNSYSHKLGYPVAHASVTYNDCIKYGSTAPTKPFYKLSAPTPLFPEKGMDHTGRIVQERLLDVNNCKISDDKGMALASPERIYRISQLQRILGTETLERVTVTERLV